MDLKNLTDDQLDQHRIEVLVEIERRQKLANIPDQVRGLATAYKAGGGDEQNLIDAVTAPAGGDDE
jgi:hypothetical protein